MPNDLDKAIEAFEFFVQNMRDDRKRKPSGLKKGEEEEKERDIMEYYLDRNEYGYSRSQCEWESKK
jgi:hypothetical protein